MYKSRYFSEQELARVLADTDLELDRRATEERVARIQTWITDPRNKAVIDANPTVQALRRLGPVPATPAPAAPVLTPPAAPHRPPTRAELEAQRPWLRPAKPNVKIIDPDVR